MEKRRAEETTAEERGDERIAGQCTADKKTVRQRKAEQTGG